MLFLVVPLVERNLSGGEVHAVLDHCVWGVFLFSISLSPLALRPCLV